MRTPLEAAMKIAVAVLIIALFMMVSWYYSRTMSEKQAIRDQAPPMLYEPAIVLDIAPVYKTVKMERVFIDARRDACDGRYVVSINNEGFGPTVFEMDHIVVIGPNESITPLRMTNDQRVSMDRFWSWFDKSRKADEAEAAADKAVIASFADWMTGEPYLEQTKED